MDWQLKKHVQFKESDLEEMNSCYFHEESNWELEPKTDLEVALLFKGAVSRDFRTLFFFIYWTHLGPW